jgi:hypothetical protein
MRIEIHLDDAPEFGTEAVRKAVGISRQDDPKTRSVIYYEQPESVVEVCAEVFDHEVGGFVSVSSVAIPVHALRAALRAVEDNSLDAMLGEVKP